ncbi:uncharacterized protein LOC107221050 isoform X2 [Neodiprion lecontei]|uniref:Uncharacterized protein LOC107221050 isoform X2 n=1 Tax=Neodiprion lecontei TaxID=441921 RepID=A0ABM3GMI8_NEOLC|nr:uncharacterized protein LOC107221050 isoform X2 [Neodiprion lecontei]
MTPFYDSQDFYKKMIELQERLRKSEEERMKLEERFNLLSQDSRNRREACINNLRMRYIEFLEEQRLRDERNHEILGALDKIDGSLARMTARTDRLGILRKQYEAYLLRLYANRSAGGNGDSGVGSHNDEKPSKTGVQQTRRNRGPTQNATDNSATFIPQTNYPQSYLGSSNTSQFNVPRYAGGQEIRPEVEVFQKSGQGDGPKVAQSGHTQQLFCGTRDLNLQNIPTSQTQLAKQFSEPQFPRPSHQFASSTRFRDVSNPYLAENPRSPYLVDQVDPSMIGLRSDRTNVRMIPEFPIDLTDENFGPYRHSTPLPGYLDYSTRYLRNPSGHEAMNLALRSGFTRTDLENVVHRNEQILPRDYLHNSETIKPSLQTSKLASEKRRTLDHNPSEETYEDDLDQYINRIRSLHRENNQSLEVLDIEQNTSGDLLNATLSEDGPLEPLALHSDDKVKIKKIDAPGVADNFEAATTAVFSNNRDIPNSKLQQMMNDKNFAAKPKLVESDVISQAALESDVTLDNLSISATRDDILSETASLGVSHIQDKSAVASDKFKPKVEPPITDLRATDLNIEVVATVSKNSPADLNVLLPNKPGEIQVPNSAREEYLSTLKKSRDLDKKITADKPTLENVPTRDEDFSPEETEVHEDIEGDKVTLIKPEQVNEQVIDVVKELRPPSLQHYERNIVEVHVNDEDKKDKNTPKILPDDTGKQITALDLPENDKKQLEAIPDASYQDDALERQFEQNPDQEYSNYDHYSAQNLPQDVNESLDTGQRFEQNPQQSYDPDTHEQLDYDGKPIDNEFAQVQQSHGPEPDQLEDSNQVCNTDQQYQPDTTQQYAQESNPHDPYGQYSTDPSQQYVADPNEEYRHDSNEQHIVGSDEQYVVNPNDHYTADPNEQYSADPNAQYGYYDDKSYQNDQNAAYDNAGNEQYDYGDNQGYEHDPNQQYEQDPSQQYEQDPSQHYEQDPSQQYEQDPSQQYEQDPNQQYEQDPSQQYEQDPSQQYEQDPNQQYEQDPSQQYEQDPSQQYEQDPSQQYEQDPNQQYEQDPSQQYEQDPSQQYEQDPSQQYEQDPSQQYEHDPNQEYEHDPNQQFVPESYARDTDQEYKEQGYGENQGYDPTGYEESEQHGNLEVGDHPDEIYENRNVNLELSEQHYLAVDTEKSNRTTSHEVAESDDTRVKDHSVEEKKKDKDVIRALLESDTESTIERNPSNNTESDFDFN